MTGVNSSINFFSSDGASVSRGEVSFQKPYPIRSRKMNKFFKKTIYFSFLLLVILIGIIFYLTHKSTTMKSPTIQTIVNASDKRINVQPATLQQTLKREYNFPIKDQNGKEISKFTYTLENAQLRNEIIVKGEKATAVKGKTFLIINLKITNNYTKSLQINARDYMRLIVNNSTEKLAPDIHNDPLEVQAISTKYTSLGFPIDDNFSSLTLQVGEIIGNKDLIQLNLK